MWFTKKFKLNPTDVQINGLIKLMGLQTKIYNQCLRKRAALYEYQGIDSRLSENGMLPKRRGFEAIYKAAPEWLRKACIRRADDRADRYMAKKPVKFPTRKVAKLKHVLDLNNCPGELHRNVLSIPDIGDIPIDLTGAPPIGRMCSTRMYVQQTYRGWVLAVVFGSPKYMKSKQA